MSYRNSQHCLQSLQEIEAIDYFVATELLSEVATADMPAEHQSQLLHCFIALSASIREGSSCLPLAAIANQHKWQLADKAGFVFADVVVLETVLNALAISTTDNASIVLENNALYLRRYWQFEQQVAQRLAAGFSSGKFVLVDDVLHKAQGIMASLFPATASAQADASNTKDFIDWQAIAVANALGQQYSVIAGGPGTGKTYTVTKLLMALQLLNDNQLKIKLAAPTGKAAQRMQESIDANIQALQAQLQLPVTLPKEAQTLHRLLGIGRDPVSPRYHQQNPIDCDLLVVDEVSMVDLPMMARILRALPEPAQLVLIGDAKQLPSVEVGQIMADISVVPHQGYSAANAAQIARLLSNPQLATKIVASHEITAVDYFNQLHKTHRQQASTNPHTISALAEQVIAGDSATSWALLQSAKTDSKESCQISQTASADSAHFLRQLVTRFYAPIVNAPDISSALALLKQFRLLMANREGDVGVEAINIKVEQLLGVHHQRYYQGRPIMVSENDYSNGLFNGDIGLIWPDPLHPEKLSAWFEVSNDIKQVALSRLPKVETVYAMTIHKTQGSEFEQVAILIPNVESRVQSKELLYTGITRAKKQVYIIADENHWQAVFKQSSSRYSGLGHKLVKAQQ